MPVVFTPASGIPDGELRPSQEELAVATGSCLNQALAVPSLSTDQRAQLLATTKIIRVQVSSSADIVNTRRAKVRVRMAEISSEIESLDSGDQQVVTFFRLMKPAIDSCPEGQSVAADVKSSTGRVFNDITELRYQLGLAQTKALALTEESNAVAATLASLDRISLLLGS